MTKQNIKTFLTGTGLLKDYTRMAILDPRVPEILEALLPYRDYCVPGNDTPLLLQGLKEAHEKAQWHFDNSDPNVVASLARDDYMTALEELLQTLKDGHHAH